MFSRSDNVLLNNGEWKLCDYGLSKEVKKAFGEASKKFTGKIGTPYYMSP